MYDNIVSKLETIFGPSEAANYSDMHELGLLRYNHWEGDKVHLSMRLLGDESAEKPYDCCRVNLIILDLERHSKYLDSQF